MGLRAGSEKVGIKKIQSAPVEYMLSCLRNIQNIQGEMGPF